MSTSDRDDLADLDAIIGADLDRQREAERIEKARKKLAREGISGDERAELTRLVNQFDELRSWDSVASVALIWTQHCTLCASDHEWFAGWFKEQRHRVVKNTRRLVAGHGSPDLPQRIERHKQPDIAHCPTCLPSILGELK